MKKIALIAYAPGSANAIFPLIKSLKEKYIVDLYPFHSYASNLWKEEIYSGEFEDIFKLNYDLIITGTDNTSSIYEKNTITMCEKYNIKSMSILDLKGNYKDRYSVNPDYIISIDEESKLDTICEGISPNKIFTLGNPHFDRLKNYIHYSKIEPPYNISFFSQPLNKSKEAFYYLLKIKDFYPELINSITFRPHPREDFEWALPAINNKDVCINMDFDYLKLILKSDISVSVSSTALLEASIIGKNVIYFKNKNDTLIKINDAEFRSPVMNLINFNATKKCIDLISEILDNKKG